MDQVDCVVIGAGVVGLAVAKEILCDVHHVSGWGVSMRCSSSVTLDHSKQTNVTKCDIMGAKIASLLVLSANQL